MTSNCPLRGADLISRLLRAPKWVSNSDWMATFLAGLAPVGVLGRVENTIELDCPELSNLQMPDGVSLILHGRQMIKQPDNCSVRIALVDGAGDHWNLIRCNGPGGHTGSHTNVVTGAKVTHRGRPLPHTHYLTEATLTAIDSGVHADPENYVVPGGFWGSIAQALVGIARRANIHESPPSILEAERMTLGRRLP